MLTIIALVTAVLFLPWPWNLVLVSGAAVVDIAETGALVRWSRRSFGPARVGSEALVGSTGVALGRIDPESLTPLGQVRVGGEIWNARSDEAIEPGARVTVRAVGGLVLDVERARGAVRGS